MSILEQKRQHYIEERARLIDDRNAEIEKLVTQYRESLEQEAFPEIEQLDSLIAKIDEIIAIEAGFTSDEVAAPVTESETPVEEATVEAIVEEETPVEDEESTIEANTEAETEVETPIEEEITQMPQDVETVEEPVQAEEPRKDEFDALREDLHRVRTTLDNVSRPGMSQVFSPKRG